jgi:hypothetical protein
LPGGRAVLCRAVWRWLLAARGCTPEPPKIPSPQIQPDQEFFQVDHLAAALERVVSIQQDVPPDRRGQPPGWRMDWANSQKQEQAKKK